MREYCECLGVRSPKDALRDIWDEVIEVFGVRNFADFKDEMSDVSFGIGRLVAGLFGKVYVRIPGDGAHVRKIDVRMIRRGCVRSDNQISKGNTCLTDLCDICGTNICGGTCNG